MAVFESEHGLRFRFVPKDHDYNDEEDGEDKNKNRRAKEDAYARLSALGAS